MKAALDFQKDLLKYLKDPEAAAEYLNAALENEDSRVFFIALRNVAAAQGNMSKFAQQCKMSRASLYKMTSGEGNPTIGSILRFFRCIGLDLKIEKRRNSRLAHA
jgi:probable addiction module antidote protein